MYICLYNNNNNYNTNNDNITYSAFWRNFVNYSREIKELLCEQSVTNYPDL